MLALGGIVGTIGLALFTLYSWEVHRRERKVRLLLTPYCTDSRLSIAAMEVAVIMRDTKWVGEQSIDAAVSNSVQKKFLRLDLLDQVPLFSVGFFVLGIVLAVYATIL